MTRLRNLSQVLSPWLVALPVTCLALVWLTAARRSYETAKPGDASEQDLERRGAGRFAQFDPLQLVEFNLYDWRVHLATRRAPKVSPQLGLVAIQDSTIERMRRGFPLDERHGLLFERMLYGRVLRELAAQGARLVAFDVVLTEERKDHPKVALPDGRQIDSDAFFAGQIDQTKRAILACPLNGSPAALFRQSGAILGAVDRTIDGDGVTRRVPVFLDFQLLSLPLLSFAERRGLEVRAANQGRLAFINHLEMETNYLPISAQGTVQVGLDPSSITNIRKGVRDLVAFAPQRVWNMGVLMAASALGLDLSQAQVSKGKIQVPGTNGVSVTLPIDASTNLLTTWSTSVRGVPFEDFADVLLADRLRQSNEVAEFPTGWKDKLVLIGSIATGNNLTDLGATPLDAKDNLVGIYLNVANSIIQNRFVHRLPLWLELLLTALLSAAAAVLTWRLKTTWAITAVLLLGCLFAIAAVFAFFKTDLWIPLAHPLLAGLLLNHGSMLAYRTIFEQRERQRVRSVFAKIVSPNIVQELLKAERLGLGGARRQVTVFFADVRGFTEMTDLVQAQAEAHVRSNALPPEAAEAYFDAQSAELLATVNRYLATIADVIKARGGTLDKYIGDCVMAFWGAPAANPTHAVEAVLAAIDAQRAIYRLNTERERENQRREQENVGRRERGEPLLPALEVLALGTGINTGMVTVGLMGSDAHIVNYTVFGREVNLASRLEGVSGRSRIIIGETTFQELRKLAPELAQLCRSLDPVPVKGFRQPVPVYEVIWREAGDTMRLSKAAVAKAA